MKLDDWSIKLDSLIFNQTESKEVTNHENGNFWNYLNNALQDVNQYQEDAALNAQRLSMGDEDFLHNTTIGYERARLSLQLMIEVRNKIVEAYQEIMRIQM